MAARNARPTAQPDSIGEVIASSHPFSAPREVRILIIDDDEATGQVLKSALARPEFRIRTVADPEAVARHLQTAPESAYDLIVLDYVLPGLEPEQVFEWIREHQPDAAIIVVTGYPSMDSALNCLRAHIHDYLTKPFEIAEFQRVVMRCLEEKGVLRMSELALREAIGAAIRERRKAMKLTLAQIAARTEVSLGYLSQIELGKNSASVETLYRICLGLGIPLSELFQVVQKPR